MKELAGYNVLITGATGGLGRALSTAFWNAGANLLLAGRSPKRLNDLSESLVPTGDQTLELIDCDLAQPDGAANLVGFVRGRWEWLDTLVNNAGILGPVGPAWDNDWDAWEATVRMNLLVPVQLCRGLIPMMGRRGSIINISGGGATSPRPNFTAYGASKAALARFSETLAVETASRGIRVNCIAPGVMRTRMVQEVVTLGADRSGRAGVSQSPGSHGARRHTRRKLRQNSRCCWLSGVQQSDFHRQTAQRSLGSVARTP